MDKDHKDHQDDDKIVPAHEEPLLDPDAAQISRNKDLDSLDDMDDSEKSTSGDEMSISDMRKWKRVFGQISSDGAQSTS